MKVKKALQAGQFAAALILIVFVILQMTNTIKTNSPNIMLYIILVINIILVIVNMTIKTEKANSDNNGSD